MKNVVFIDHPKCYWQYG